MAGRVEIEKRGGVGLLLLSHPERRNALTRAMWEAIPKRARELDDDPDVRVVVLRGAGEEAFVSGADISEFEEVRAGPGAAEYDRMTDRAFGALREIGKPVVAAIHGYCIGGGAAVALCADLRYAADDAELAIPPARLGLGYAVRNVEALAAVVGTANAREILFTGRRFSAEEAHGMGWVHRVYPKAVLDAEVEALCTILERNAPLTIKSAKTVLRELDKADDVRDREAMEASVKACMRSEDYAEGVKAFLEKRRPHFRGR